MQGKQLPEQQSQSREERDVRPKNGAKMRQIRQERPTKRCTEVSRRLFRWPLALHSMCTGLKMVIKCWSFTYGHLVVFEGTGKRKDQLQNR